MRFLFRRRDGHPVLGKMKNVKPTTDNRSMKGPPRDVRFSIVGCPVYIGFSVGCADAWGCEKTMKNGKPTTENRSMKGCLRLLGFPLSVVRFALVDVGCPSWLPV
jgi:hypothetical protein